MSSITKASVPLLRSWTRHQLSAARPAALAVQTRGRADQASSSFDSPFHRSGGTARDTRKVPDFGKYKSDNNEVSNRIFQYFMVGSMGAITAAGAKATVQGRSLWKNNIWSND